MSGVAGVSPRAPEESFFQSMQRRGAIAWEVLTHSKDHLVIFGLELFTCLSPEIRSAFRSAWLVVSLKYQNVKFALLEKDLRGRIEDLTLAVKNAIDEKIKAVAEAVGLRRANQNLSQEIERLNTNVKRLQDRIAALEIVERQRNDLVQGQSDAAQVREAVLEDRDVMEKHVEVVEQENRKLRDENSRLAEERDAAIKGRDGALEAKSKAIAKLQAHVDENLSLRNELTQLREAEKARNQQQLDREKAAYEQLRQNGEMKKEFTTLTPLLVQQLDESVRDMQTEMERLPAGDSSRFRFENGVRILKQMQGHFKRAGQQ